MDDAAGPSNAAEPPPAQADAGPTEIKLRIVKCSLRRALALPDADYALFSAMVERYVEYVSRTMRRASLALLRHLVALAEAGQPVPDLFHQSDTYWKNWLRWGYGSGPAVDGGALPVPPSLGPVPAVPEGVVELDQVVAYAAITFRTAVQNNAYVPLIPRLTRLLKGELAHRNDPAAPDWWQVLQQLRAKEPNYTGWPVWLRDYVMDVRDRLDVPAAGGVYIHDEWGKQMSFPRLFRFNYWMQQRFRALELRRLALSPIIKVGRKHVRLDTRVLIQMYTRLFPEDDRVRLVRQLKARHDAARKAQEPGFLHPDDVFLPKAPAAIKKSSCTAEAWDAYRKAVKDHEAVVADIRASPVYQAQLKAHRLMADARLAVTRALFSSIPIPKSGSWEFDGSVVTDGVSVSLQYVSVRPMLDSGLPRKKTSKKGKQPSTDVYDRHLTTFIPGPSDGGGDVLVLGVDPGRINIATVSYVIDDARNKLVRETGHPVQYSWTLSRGEYLTTSGVRHMDQKKAERFSSLHPHWSSLGADAAALRTSRLEDLDLYLTRLSAFDEQWWQLALRRRESRDNLRRYSGKRSVLDAFFSRVKRRAEKMFPGVDVRVGYGSAVLSMKPTGRGEVAVPTTGTYLACKRVFGSKAVGVVDEAYTTQKEWETGDVKELVYAVITGDDPRTSRHLRHTTSRRPPEVLEEHRAATLAEIEKMKSAAARRRSVLTGEPATPAPRQQPQPPERLRYPEVRGLRFSPERRMYLNRDREAARTIARLRTQELRGLLRPVPFCR